MTEEEANRQRAGYLEYKAAIENDLMMSRAALAAVKQYETHVILTGTAQIFNASMTLLVGATLAVAAEPLAVIVGTAMAAQGAAQIGLQLGLNLATLADDQKGINTFEEMQDRLEKYDPVKALSNAVKASIDSVRGASEWSETIGDKAADDASNYILERLLKRAIDGSPSLPEQEVTPIESGLEDRIREKERELKPLQDSASKKVHGSLSYTPQVNDFTGTEPQDPRDQNSDKQIESTPSKDDNHTPTIQLPQTDSKDPHRPGYRDPTTTAGTPGGDPSDAPSDGDDTTDIA